MSEQETNQSEQKEQEPKLLQTWPKLPTAFDPLFQERIMESSRLLSESVGAPVHLVVVAAVVHPDPEVHGTIVKVAATVGPGAVYELLAGLLTAPESQIKPHDGAVGTVVGRIHTLSHQPAGVPGPSRGPENSH